MVDELEPTFRLAPIMINEPSSSPYSHEISSTYPSTSHPPHQNEGSMFSGGSPEGSVSEDESEGIRPKPRQASSTSRRSLAARPVRRASSSKHGSTQQQQQQQLESPIGSTLMDEVPTSSSANQGEQPMRVTFTSDTGNAIEGWGRGKVEGS